MSSFIRDDRAAMEIPLRLVVYVILAGTVIAIATLGLQNTLPGIATNAMDKQVGEIAVSLDTMQYGAARNLLDPASPAGNIRTFTINIPETTSYLAFGVDPDLYNDGDMKNNKKSLTGKGNVIYYLSYGDKKRVPLDGSIEIREGIFENGRWVLNDENGSQYGVVITGKGTFELSFEVVYDPVSKSRYILTHFTDELDAEINPYISTALPNSLRVSVDRIAIPADGVTVANILVRLKDRKGKDAAVEGIEITLNSSLGEPGTTKLVTDATGKAYSNITSNMVGTALITAGSPGLNQGSTYLNIEQVPVVLNFDQWINRSDDSLSASFISNQERSYSISLHSYGTEFLGWPNASLKIDEVIIGEEIIDSPDLIIKDYSRITLPAGNHTVNVRMTNDLFVPLLGDRNLYVERVVLSG